MRFGKLIGIYMLIGLLFVPLVYWNSANGYRSEGTAHNVGQAITGGVFFWPSYLFSIEPEIDGDSVEDFAKSFRAVLEYRNTKWFAGGSGNSSRRNENRHIMERALLACTLALDTKKQIKDEANAVARMQSSSDPYFNALEKKVMKHLDGEDFAGLAKEGLKCLKKL